LLGQQISPPYGIVARHLDYLQKWREYLLWVWYDDSNKGVDKTHVQKAVDDLILTILLIDFVKQSEITAIPSLEEILKMINKPTAHNLCEAVRNQIPCRLLKHIYTTLLLRKTSEKYTTKHIHVKGKNGLRRKLSNVNKQDNLYIEACKLPATACTSANWILESENKISLLSKIESDGIPLGKLPIRIRFGIATGADDVFLLRNVEDLNSQLVLAESRFLNDIFVFESSVLRPILRGRHIKGYSAVVPQTLCIFPYDDNRKVIAEDVFSTKFPRVYRYLTSCKKKLSSRKLKSGQPWYAFRSVEISQLMQSQKLVASVVNSGGGFALDEHGHILCSNSVVIMCPDGNTIDTYYLIGVLNSSVFKVWGQHRMPNLGSGWYSYRINIMRNFPVPTSQSGKKQDLCSKIADLTRELLNERSAKDDYSNIISSIDNKVIELYDVSDILPL